MRLKKDWVLINISKDGGLFLQPAFYLFTKNISMFAVKRRKAMNPRINQIDDLFHFLCEAKQSRQYLNEVFEKLENEIELETVQKRYVDNEYLENLQQIKNHVLGHYLDDDDYSKFMNNLIHVVKLHGLGVAQ